MQLCSIQNALYGLKKVANIADFVVRRITNNRFTVVYDRVKYWKQL